MQIAANSTSSEYMGRSNRRLVLSNILFNQPVSRTEIAKATSLTAASVSRITRDLVEAGLVIEHDISGKPTGPGRRFVELSINPVGGYVLAISINVFQQSVALTDLKNNLIDQVELKLEYFTDSEVVIDEVIQAARTLLEKYPQQHQRLLGGGVTMTGAIDPINGVIRFAPAVKWKDVALGPKLEAALNIPIALESLPNALNLTESIFMNNNGHRNVLLFNCSLGIGASLYLDGRLIRSTDYTAGLAGSVAYPFGKKEVAVSLDQAAGGWGILSEIDGNGENLKDYPANEMADRLLKFIESVDQEEGREREVMHKAGATLGRVLALYSGLIHPKSIVLVGPLSRSSVYVEAVKESMDARCSADCVMPELIVSQLTNALASRWFSVYEFLGNRDIDIKKLKQLDRTA